MTIYNATCSCGWQGNNDRLSHLEQRAYKHREYHRRDKYPVEPDIRISSPRGIESRVLEE